MDPERNFRLTSFDPGRDDEQAHLAELIRDAIEAS
jgi:hypothetical protein